jgi:hypothetical protein
LDEDLKEHEKAHEYFRRANFIEEGGRKNGLAAWVLEVAIGEEEEEELGEARGRKHAMSSAAKEDAIVASKKYVIPERRGKTSTVYPVSDHAGGIPSIEEESEK